MKIAIASLGGIKRMEISLSHGGLGDCFIAILKILEYERPLIHTHIDNNKNPERLELAKDLLDYFEIENDCYTVNNIRRWWGEHHKNFDKHFNVCAKGYINIPRRSYHWEPCRDEGFSEAFAKYIPPKKNFIAVQVEAGMNSTRNHKIKPVVEYVRNNYDPDKVLWFGIDNDFIPEFGINYSGKLDFIPALEKIRECKYFVGFNSILLYWALWHKTECFLFTDHQGREDLRIHDEWKKYLSFDLDMEMKNG
jgi:hypothetical protein